MNNLNENLREALFETLSGILSPNQDVRNAAEQHLKVLEVTEDFGVNLTSLTLEGNGQLPIRQLASVLLKQYVNVHWSPQSEKFCSPEATPQAKQQIRELLPHGLRESISKVRTSVAYAIAAIASWDWPEAWPELFNILLEYLKCGEETSVHGAMRVLQEFTRDATDQQMPHIAPHLLPEIYRVFKEEQKYSIRTRARAVGIFNTICGMIFTMSELKQDTKTLLQPVLPAFTEALVTTLQLPDGHTMDSGLRRDILESLAVLVQGDSKLMSQWMSHILIPVWDTLTQSAEKYQNISVNSIEHSDDAVDSDGAVLGFDNLIISIFDFVSVMIETNNFRKTVRTSIPNLIYYLIVYMQITDDQIEKWSGNPEVFVEDEEEEGTSFSVRVSAQDLLLELCSEFKKSSSAGLCEAVTKHLKEAEVRRNNNDQYWWKIHEACMLCIGSVRDMIISELASGKLNFDLTGFLEHVVLQDLSQNASQFLLGRCLWTASRFCKVMNPDLLNQFLQATVSALQVSAPVIVRICGCRAVWNYCEVVKEDKSKKSILTPYLSGISDGLVSLGADHGKEVLGLVLEALSIMIGIDEQYTTNSETKIISLTIAVFLKHHADPVLMPLVLDMIKELSKNDCCLRNLKQRLIPTLVSILNQSRESVSTGIQACSMEALEILVRASKPPLCHLLMQSGFAAAAACTLTTDDHTTMQNGGECMRAYVSVSPEQVYSFVDCNGRSGSWYLVQVCTHLLSPGQADSPAAFVGRLVAVTIAKLGDHLGESLHLLLKAVLSKLQSAETLTVTQSLIMVYAGLMTHRLEAVLDFLSSIPGPNGQPALEFVLTEWSARQHVFHGDYDRKVSSVALTKLLEHTVQNQDKRLISLRVKGEPVIKNDEGIRTRSKSSATEEWTTIPLLAKVFKLLVNELSNAIEANLASNDDDDDEDEWEDKYEETDINEMMKHPLSTLLAPAELYPEIEDDLVDDDDDPDCLADPLNSINLEEYLSQFLCTFSTQPWFAMHFSAHLNPMEKQVLQTIGVNV